MSALPPLFPLPCPAVIADISPASFGLGVGLGIVLLIGLAILIGIGLFALWIWMLIDCAQAPDNPADPNARVIWILVLVFTGWLGAILYFFIVRQPRRARERPPSPPPPSPQTDIPPPFSPR